MVRVDVLGRATFVLVAGDVLSPFNAMATIVVVMAGVGLVADILSVNTGIPTVVTFALPW